MRISDWSSDVCSSDLVGCVVGLADLLQDHRALALQLLLKKGRALQDVGNDVEGERRVLGQHLGIEGGVLAAGVGVDLPADRLDLLGDGLRAAPLGALEHHVLEQMRDAVQLRRLRSEEHTSELQSLMRISYA